MPLDPVAEDGKGYEGPQGMMGIRRPGGFAELVCVPAFKTNMLPKSLGFHEAAVVMRHCPTAWNLLVNIAQLKAGEWVLIMGASGNLGTVGIQIAKNVVGAKVICAAGSRDRADVGLEFGADHAIDYSTQDILAAIMKITGGKGVDVLYDNIANPKVLPKAFHGIGDGGRLVTAVAHGGPNVEIDFFHLYDKRITIRGMPGSKPSDLPLCFQAAADGKIKVRIAQDRPRPVSRLSRRRDPKGRNTPHESHELSSDALCRARPRHEGEIQQRLGRAAQQLFRPQGRAPPLQPLSRRAGAGR